MPDVVELGARLRKKFPDRFKNMTSKQVGEAARDHFPDDFGDFEDAAGPRRAPLLADNPRLQRQAEQPRPKLRTPAPKPTPALSPSADDIEAAAQQQAQQFVTGVRMVGKLAPVGTPTRAQIANPNAAFAEAEDRGRLRTPNPRRLVGQRVAESGVPVASSMARFGLMTPDNSSIAEVTEAGLIAGADAALAAGSVPFGRLITQVGREFGRAGLAKLAGSVAAGVATGEAAGFLTREGAKKIGVPDDVANLLGTAADIAVDPAAIVGGIKLARGGRARLKTQGAKPNAGTKERARVAEPKPDAELERFQEAAKRGPGEPSDAAQPKQPERVSATRSSGEGPKAQRRLGDQPARSGGLAESKSTNPDGRAVKSADDAGAFQRSPSDRPNPRTDIARVKTPSGTAVDTRLEVVEADELITSNRDNLTELDERFPQELQNRQRDRVVSEDLIKEIEANPDFDRLNVAPTTDAGAPIVGADNVVEVGNARTIGVLEVDDAPLLAAIERPAARPESGPKAADPKPQAPEKPTRSGREAAPARQEAPEVRKPRLGDPPKAQAGGVQPGQAVEFAALGSTKTGTVVSTDGAKARVKLENGTIVSTNTSRLKSAGATSAKPATIATPRELANSIKKAAKAPRERPKPVSVANPKAAKKLRSVAASLRKAADERLEGGLSQNMTARRARIRAGMVGDADRMKRQADRAEKLAEAQANGTATGALAAVDSKALIEALDRMAVVSKPGRDQFGNTTRPIEPTLPEARVDSRDKNDLLEAAKGLRGVQDARRAVQSISGTPTTAQARAITTLRNAIKKDGRKDPWRFLTIADRIKDRARFTRIGVTSTRALQQLVRDFDALTTPKELSPAEKKARKVQQLTDDLIGTKIPGFFPTPKPVIDRLIKAADIQPGQRVLEPSAGKGDIVEAIGKDAEVEAFEFSSTLNDLLAAKDIKVTGRDFLRDTPAKPPDRIVMNPPFEKGQDIDHVRRAFDVVAPGGRVVSVMSEGPFFRSDKKSAEFRDWLEAVGGTSEKLDAGSFTGKDAFRQTGTSTRMVVIDKPLGSDSSGRGGFVRIEPRGKEQAAALTPGANPPPRPTLGGKLFQFRQQVAAKAASAKRRYISSEGVQDAREQLIDRTAVIQDFVEPARASGLSPEADPGKLARTFAGAFGRADIRIDALDEIIRPVRRETNDLIEHARLDRFDELARRGVTKFPNGMTPLEVNAERLRVEERLKADPAKWGRIQQAERRIRDYSDSMLTELRDEGIISAEAFAKIKANNEKYLPLQRVGLLADDIDRPMGPRAFSVASQDVVKSIVGSEREVVDPLESMVRNTYKNVQLMERNRVARAMFNLKDLPEMEGMVQPLKSGQDAPHGFEPLYFMRDGQPVRFAVPTRVAGAMKHLNEKQADLITRVVSFGTRALRAGATGANAVFIPRNALRDFQTLGITQGTGVLETSNMWMQGMSEVLFRGKYFDEWRDAGGSFSGYFESIKGPQRTAKKLRRAPADRFIRTVVNPFEMVRIMGEVIEQAPRVGAFKRGRVKLGEGRTAAALRSRNATVDFARAGSSMKLLNQWVPFVNARLQGNLNVFKAFRESPTRALMVAGQMVIAPAIATYVWNNRPENREVYDQISDFEKQNNFILVLGPEKDERDRFTNVVKIPKGDVGRALGNPLESFLEFVRGRDAAALDTLALQVASDLSPVSFERDGEFSLGRLASDLTPPPAKAVLEGAFNKNFFTGRDIVPQNRINASPPLQRFHDTPAAAVKIGEALNISPLKIQQGVRSQFGGVGEQVLGVASGQGLSTIGSQFDRAFSSALGRAEADRQFKSLDELEREREDQRVEAELEAQQLYEKLKNLPQKEQEAKLEAALKPIAKADPEKAARVVKEYAQEVKRNSLTAFERSLKSAPVSVRARYIEAELAKLPPFEQGQLRTDLEDKRILTPSVQEAMLQTPKTAPADQPNQ